MAPNVSSSVISPRNPKTDDGPIGKANRAVVNVLMLPQ